MSGHYLELVPKQQSVYYVDMQKLVYIDVRCILPTVCPELEGSGQKKVKRKFVDTYKLSLELHEELLSFLMR